MLACWQAPVLRASNTPATSQQLTVLRRHAKNCCQRCILTQSRSALAAVPSEGGGLPCKKPWQWTASLLSRPKQQAALKCSMPLTSRLSQARPQPHASSISKKGDNGQQALFIIGRGPSMAMMFKACFDWTRTTPALRRRRACAHTLNPTLFRRPTCRNTQRKSWCSCQCRSRDWRTSCTCSN